MIFRLANSIDNGKKLNFRSLSAVLSAIILLCPILSVAQVVKDDSTVFRQIKPSQPNVIPFDSIQAKFLRFVVYSSHNGDPAIDELLIYGTDDEDAPNLARINVKRVAASSCIVGYDIHRTENVVDGNFGNAASWVAGKTPTCENPEWIEIEWNDPVVVNRVVFSRDRQGEYADRVPLHFEIQISNDGEIWEGVASVVGFLDEVPQKGLSSYNSSWFSDVPTGKEVNWEPLKDVVVGSELTPYDKALQNAFLAEENAILKIAGFADCEPWLIQRHYPEYVEPERKPDQVLPLPCFDSPLSEKELLDCYSAGTVWAFSTGSFASGPLVKQSVNALITNDSLRLRISVNRILSENIALISTENIPARGLIVLREEKLIWKPVDWLAGTEETELTGSFDKTNGVLDFSIPLRFLPEWSERGLYVSLGIGARHVLPGGRPIHFRPAKFSASFMPFVDENANFSLRLCSYSDDAIELSTSQEIITLKPHEKKELILQGKYGQAGPELVWNAAEKGSDEKYCLVAFQYDPCYRPLCQLGNALERAESSADKQLDKRDFEKRFIIPGTVNPRYIDTSQYDYRDPLGEYVELCRYFDGISPSEIDHDSFKARAVKLWKEWKNSRTVAASPIGKRELFLKIRLLKRELFLSNSELEPVEHILANKRNPFWPSHNYSDLFDSSWNPGGSVVLIDIPWLNGRLAPEFAKTLNLIEAGNGVIRNPSLSFDSKKVFYSFRETQNDYFKIYEYEIATGKKRLVSPPGPFHDFWPIELPDGGLAFISTRCKKKFICWRPQAFVLWRMNKDGNDLSPLSYANLSEFAPSVADTGSILWTRSEYVDKGADYGHTLWSIRPDGSSPELVFGNTINLPQGYANGRQVPDSTEVSCVLISHFGDLNGPIALIDTSLGPHDPSAIRSITPEVPWPGFWARTETFREPIPITRDILLVAHAALDRFGLYLIDRFGNRELLTIDDSIDTICPQLFEARDTPPVIKSSVNPDLAMQGLGRFSVTNVYRGLEGQVERGVARYLRVCQEMPTPLKQLDDGSYQSDHEPFMEYYASPVDVLQGPFGWPSYVAKGVLGTVEIEEDGSVDFLAPAEKVLYFELLDENFNEIQRMRSVVQLRPGESRSCIGCHENRLSVPDGGLTLASTHDPQTLREPPWGSGPFWYERVVQPIFDRRCVDCHNAETVKNNVKQLDLTRIRDENKIPASYRSLVQSGDIHYFDYTWGAGQTTKAAPYSFGVSQSRVWEILKDNNHHNVSLKPEEEQAIKCWIDLNVPLWGDYQMRRERD